MTSASDSSNRIASIQGLRGLAVALVVLYHGGIFFNGGFIGVDIFFVISGYVIGASLLREYTRAGEISWSNFYFRRARRLLPALSTTLIGTILIYLVLEGIDGAKSLTRALNSGAFFFSNFYFFLEQGYVALDTNPLRNLWSLSVEEQFYFALPILFIIASVRLRSKGQLVERVVIFGAIALVVSFVGNVILVNHSLQFSIPQFLLPRRFGFFSPFTRAWEFLLGLLIAIRPETMRKLGRVPLLSVSAFAVILFFSIWLDSWQPFPGWFALPIAIAAVAIVASSDFESFTTIVLSNRVFVFLGDISYSLYLIHWPLLVVLRQRFGDSDPLAIVAIGISVFLSALMLRFVENPVRAKSFENKKLFGLAMVALAFVPVLLLRSVSYLPVDDPSVSQEVGNSVTAAELRAKQINLGSNVCLDVHKVGLPDDIKQCIEQYSPEAPTLFLLGDSHAYSISEGVIAAAKRNGFSVMTWSRSGCPFLVTSSVNRLCNGNRDYLLEAIRDEAPAAVIIVNGVNHYLEGLKDQRFVPRGLKVRIKEVAQNYGETTDYLLNAGIKTIVMHEVPNMGRSQRDLKEFLLRTEIISAIDSEIDQSEEKYRSKIIRIDPAGALCPGGICQFSDQKGLILFSDGQHLNADGALKVSFLFDSVFASLKKK
ncbi:MAG: acyltransferase family protein [Actinomycetota bacterium]